MELDWSTFLIEIVNFAILLWILRRFLYRPVLTAMEQRRAAINASLADAERLKHEAELLEQQYRGRLEDWSREKAAAREKLQQDLDVERERLTSAMMASINRERDKARTLDQRRAEQTRRDAQALALTNATRFTSRLLAELASPELEARIVELGGDELRTLMADALDKLRGAWHADGARAMVTSAYPLSDAQRQRLRERFEALLGQPGPAWDYRQDPALIAGLRVTLGSWAWQANLQDELRAFTESAHGDA